MAVIDCGEISGPCGHHVRECSATGVGIDLLGAKALLKLIMCLDLLDERIIFSDSGWTGGATVRCTTITCSANVPAPLIVILDTKSCETEVAGGEVMSMIPE